MTPLTLPFSVLLPVYNSEKYLRASITSILEQSFTDFELLVIDDGSTDASPSIISSLSADPRLKVITNSKNQGIPISLNKGLKQARGKYIAIMNSDDIALQHRLKTQYDFLEAHPHIHLIGSQATALRDNGASLNQICVPCDEKKISTILPKKNIFLHSSTCFRHTKEFFYREKFAQAEDYDLYLRMLTAKKRIVNIPATLLLYRVHDDSVSHSRHAEQVLLAAKAREFYVQRKNQGKDSYDQFDPLDLFFEAASERCSPLLLAAQIQSACKANDQKLLKQLSKRYFRFFGFRNRCLFYYLIAFLPLGWIKAGRRIVWGGKSYFMEVRQKKAEKKYSADRL